MPDDRIKFSQLSAVLTINTSDIIPGATENGSSETGYSNVKFTIAQLAAKINEAITFSGLETESKYIVPAINEIKELISSIPQFDIQVVQTLPTTGVSGTVYLVPAPDGSSPNMYEEYLWINNSWEKLGSASVDLSNYYNKNQINGMLADVFSTSESYNVGDIVIYNNYLYVCIEATSGAWDSSKWSVVKLSYIIPKDLEDLDNVNIQNPTHRQGLVYDNPSGKWINGSVGGSAEATSYDNTESGLSATNVQDAIDEVDDKIEGITEPQKTVSGSVVTFSDSLPNSPLLACKASIEAVQSGSGTPSPDNIRPINGFDTVIVQNSGKNLIDISHFTFGLPATAIGSSVNSITESTRYAYYGFPSPRESVAISLISNDLDRFGTLLVFGYKGGVLSFYLSIPARTEQRIELRDFTDYDFVRVALGASAGNDTFEDLTGHGQIQIERGSTATAYEPFKGSTHTISLGQTVGKGTLNVTTGELTITHGLLSLAVADMNNSENYPGWQNIDISQYGYSGNGTLSNIRLNIGSFLAYNATNQVIFLSKAQYILSQSEWKSQYPDLVVDIEIPYVTPITVQLTPEEILTITGENNISANSGDIEVTYRTPFYVSANSTSYDNSTSGLAATNVQQAIDEIAYKDIISTLETGETTLTIVDSAITTDSTIDIYTDKFGVSPTNQEVTTGQIVLTFSAQSSALAVKVRLS